MSKNRHAILLVFVKPRFHSPSVLVLICFFGCLWAPGRLLGVPGRPSGGFVGLWVPLGVLVGVSLLGVLWVAHG